MNRKYCCKECNKILSYNPSKRGKGFCQSCGHIRKDSWRYCIDCKKRLPYGSDKNTKRCRKCFYNWYRKENRPNWKGGKVKCIDCGDETSNRKAKRCFSCYKKYSVGKNAPNYIDGSSERKYPKEFNNKLKAKIRKRDNYQCQNCDMIDEEHIIIYGSHIEVHHIDYDKENSNEENLVTLCKQCNLRANYNHSYWIVNYTSMVERKILKFNKEI